MAPLIWSAAYKVMHALTLPACTCVFGMQLLALAYGRGPLASKSLQSDGPGRLPFYCVAALPILPADERSQRLGTTAYSGAAGAAYLAACAAYKAGGCIILRALLNALSSGSVVGANLMPHVLRNMILAQPALASLMPWAHSVLFGKHSIQYEIRYAYAYTSAPS